MPSNKAPGRLKVDRQAVSRHSVGVCEVRNLRATVPPSLSDDDETQGELDMNVVMRNLSALPTMLPSTSASWSELKGWLAALNGRL